MTRSRPRRLAFTVGHRAIIVFFTLFAIFLGYGTQLIAMVAFYIIVSLWFHFYRYKYVRRGDQFTMPWPKPRTH